MHFSQYLQALNQDAPPQWRGKFLDYKALKKRVKNLGPQSQDCKLCDKATRTGCDHSKDAKFLAFLYHEVQRVDSEFTRATRQVFRQAQDGQRTGCLSCFRPSHAAHLDADKLVAQAEWCRRYAQINSVALRKIVKKHDKVCGCRTGSEFLQQLWSGSKRSHGAFLHSPLLEELKSLETMMLAERAQRGPPEHPPVPASDTSKTISVELSDDSGVSERVDLPMLPSLEKNTQVAQHYEVGATRTPDPSAHNGTENEGGNAGPALPGEAVPACTPPQGAPPEVARAIQANEAAVREVLQLRHISLASSGVGDAEDEVDPDYLCPICLEAMYQPLGLECGHKFCADCAFSSVGKGNALGTVRAILDHVEPSAACPECRTAGVFVSAMELKTTEKLIRQRYPKAWAERADDAKAKEKRLRTMLQEQRARARQTFSVARVPF